MNTKNNLFLRLEKYSLNEKSSTENLFTEILAYLLENDGVFKKNFLKLICGKSLYRKFAGADVKTQERIKGRAVIDIAFVNDKGGNLYVENKIGSSEGKRVIADMTYSQLGYYLKHMNSRDRLAYITKSAGDSPKIKNDPQFLRHLHWGKVYLLLKQRQNKAGKDLRFIIKQTMGYMEECNMSNSENFTACELREARSAFSYIRKATNLLELLWGNNNELYEFLVEKFGKNTRSLGVRSDESSKYLGFSSKKLHKKMAIYLYAYGNRINIGLGVWSRTAVAEIKNEEGVRNKVEELRKNSSKWEIDDKENGWWFVGKSFEIKTAPIDKWVKKISPQLQNVVKDLSRSKLITMVAKRLQDNL